MSHTETTLKLIAAFLDGNPRTAKELRVATGLSENTVMRQLGYLRRTEPPMVVFDSYAERETGPAAARWRWAGRSSVGSV
jgi:hypothetical protein